MKRLFILLLLVAGSLIFVLVVYPLLSKTVTIQNVGTIVTLGVEADIAQIDWGKIYPNDTATQIINVRPTGNTPATLTLNTSNWNPANASNYLTLTRNYTGEILQPNQWIPIELALHVSPQIEGITSFSFDIVIAAWEI